MHFRVRLAGRLTAVLATAVAAIAMGSWGPAQADVPVTSTEDVTAPAVSSMSVSPLIVDVRDGVNKTFTATLVATDDLSGVSSVSASYRSPSGTQYIFFGFTSWERTAGDAKAGTYVDTATVTPLMANGSYALQSLQVYDTVGNYRTYRASDGVAPATLTVQSNADDVAPVTTSVTVNPNPIDVSAGLRATTVEAQVTDDRSGVRYVYGQFTSPSGRQAAAFSARPVSGEPGVARGMTTVARYSEPGDWKLTYFCALDVAGNQECYNNATSPKVSDKFPLALQVISDPADEAKPAVSAFRLSPGQVDVTDAAATVKTDFDVTDTLSGVQYASIRFVSPRTVGATPESIQRYGFAQAPPIHTYTWNADGTYDVTEDDSKRMLSGTISAETTFPRYDRSGDWQVAEVCVIDNVNWRSCYTATTTPSLTTFGPVKLTVEWNRTPTVAVTGVTQASYTAGSEPTPGCDVSDVEDGVQGNVTPVVTGPDADGVVTVTCSYTDTGGITGSAVKTYQVVTPTNTPPSITVTGVSDTTYEFGSVPTAGCSVADAEDTGEAATADVSDVTGPLSNLGLGTVVVTCSYTDGGGLSDSDSVTYTIVDNGAPELQLTSTTVRATSNAGATVSYPATATDLVDPSPSVECTPASGSLFALGATTVTCTATDAAGNTSTGSFTVTVVPTCTATALRQPVNVDGSSVFKLGSSVPLKIILSECYGVTPGQVAPQVALKRVDTLPEGTVNEVASSGSANDGTTMRYDATSGQHIYNLSTKRSQFCATGLSCSNGDLTEGTYEVTISASELATPVKGRFNLRR